jgi:uncharacterized protein (DUF3084 family)
LAVLNGGYESRAKAIASQVLQIHADLLNAVIEEDVYKTLQHNEEMGSVRRIDRFRQDIARLQQEEVELQSVYQDSVTKKAQQAQTANA